jgi:hypothetical protein
MNFENLIEARMVINSMAANLDSRVLHFLDPGDEFDFNQIVINPELIYKIVLDKRDRLELLNRFLDKQQQGEFNFFRDQIMRPLYSVCGKVVFTRVWPTRTPGARVQMVKFESWPIAAGEKPLPKSKIFWLINHKRLRPERSYAMLRGLV